MQSHQRSTKSRQKRPKLPWGMGTLKKHGNCWWATYRDAKGKVHFDNLNTEDPAEARRLLAQRSLPKARAAVALLEQIANEEATDQGKRAGSSGTADARAVGRNRGKAPANPRPRKGAKKTIEVTLKQGPLLKGPRLIAALKKLVEIGAEVEKGGR